MTRPGPTGRAWRPAAQRRADEADADGWRAALVELGDAMTQAYRSGRAIREWWVGRLAPWR